MTRPRFRWSSRFRDGSSAPRFWSYAAGYDVTCTACGWESRTGGATRASVLRSIDDHLWDEHGLLAIGGKVLERTAIG
jgi:hypothetical protein